MSNTNARPLANLTPEQQVETATAGLIQMTQRMVALGLSPEVIGPALLLSAVTVATELAGPDEVARILHRLSMRLRNAPVAPDEPDRPTPPAAS